MPSATATAETSPASTATAENGRAAETATPAAKPQKDVNYSVDDFVTDLPAPAGPGVKSSVIRDKVNELRINEAYHSPNADGKDLWRTLAHYGNSGSATGAMKALRDHFGREGSGWFFQTAKVGDKTALYACYRPASRGADFPEPGNVPKPEPVGDGRGRPKGSKVVDGKVVKVDEPTPAAQAAQTQEKEQPKDKAAAK